MKFELDQSARHLAVRAYDADGFLVGDHRITRPVVLSGERIDLDLLPAHFGLIEDLHIERLCALRPDLLLFGTGPRQQFLPQSLMARILERGIGCETMDTAAACRSYNVLIAESRAVAAALFMLRTPSA